MSQDSTYPGLSLAVVDDRTRRLEADQSKMWDALETIKDVRVGLGRIEEQLTDGNSKFDRFERMLESHATRLGAVEQSQAVVAATCLAQHRSDPSERRGTPVRTTLGVTGSAGVGAVLWELLQKWLSSGGSSGGAH